MTHRPGEQPGAALPALRPRTRGGMPAPGGVPPPSLHDHFVLFHSCMSLLDSCGRQMWAGVATMAGCPACEAFLDPGAGARAGMSALGAATARRWWWEIAVETPGPTRWRRRRSPIGCRGAPAAGAHLRCARAAFHVDAARPGHRRSGVNLRRSRGAGLSDCAERHGPASAAGVLYT